MTNLERVELIKLADNSINDLLIGVFQLYDIYAQFLLLEKDLEKIDTLEKPTTMSTYKKLFKMMKDIADSRVLNKVQETTYGTTETPYTKEAIVRLIKLNSDSVYSFMNEIAYNEIFTIPEEV